MGYLSKSFQLFLLSSLGWAIIWIGTTVLGLLWDDYSIINHTVSILGSAAAPQQFLMNFIFILDGILLVISAFKMQQVLSRDLFDLGTPYLIAIAGIFLILLAFFPGGALIDLQVPTQVAHNTIATLLIITFIIASSLFIWEMKEYDEWKLILKIVAVITILKIIFYSSSVIVMEIDRSISSLAGLFQKLGLMLEGIWLILISYKFFKLYPVDSKLSDSNGNGS